MSEQESSPHGPNFSADVSLGSSVIDTLTPEDLREIARVAPLRRFRKGESLPELGQLSGSVFVLVREGRFLFSRTNEDGRRIVTVVVYPGHAFLRLSSTNSWEGRPEGRAQEDSSAHLLGIEALHRLVVTNPRFAWALVQLMARYSDVLEMKLEMQAFHSLPSRVAALLLRFAARSQEIKLSHGTLAEGAGASREAVTRILDMFRSQGLVSLSRNNVSILNTARLSEIAEENHTTLGE